MSVSRVVSVFAGGRPPRASRFPFGSRIGTDVAAGRLLLTTGRHSEVLGRPHRNTVLVMTTEVTEAGGREALALASAPKNSENPGQWPATSCVGPVAAAREAHGHRGRPNRPLP